jgi:tRNA threonylcarbamoyladenosine biosynthesis protein TsaE
MQPRKIIATLEQLEDVAKKILNAYPHQRIFSFSGEMGAGKTTLIKALCKYLGIQNIPTSPTFSIVNEYYTAENEPIYHFDFYRMERPEEAIDIGLFEYLESGHYCFMEWSENIETVLDMERVTIEIERIDDLTRKFTY